MCFDCGSSDLTDDHGDHRRLTKQVLDDVILSHCDDPLTKAEIVRNIKNGLDAWLRQSSEVSVSHSRDGYRYHISIEEVVDA